jgi:hypothetical protein
VPVAYDDLDRERADATKPRSAAIAAADPGALASV